MVRTRTQEPVDAKSILKHCKYKNSYHSNNFLERKSSNPQMPRLVVYVNKTQTFTIYLCKVEVNPETKVR